MQRISRSVYFYECAQLYVTRRIHASDWLKLCELKRYILACMNLVIDFFLIVS